MTTSVHLEPGGGVARVRFQSEKGVQLFSAATREQLAGVVDKLEDLADCRVVIFEAEGRTFIAGADIHELASLDAETGRELARAGQRLMNRIARLSAVTLAAVHGACAGGGCELALACDLRMAAQGAAIGLPEVKLGVIPGWGGTVRAVRLFGSAVARRMILCGELLAAEDALRLGVVDSVHAEADFRDAVTGRARQLLTCGPHALVAAKRAITDFEGGDVEEQLAFEAETFARCCADPESTEGTRAFLEKRPPVW